MSEPNSDGFLNISNLREIQDGDTPIFLVPDGEENDVLEQMDNHIEKDDGVAFDLRLGKQYYLSGDDTPQKLNEDGVLSIKPGQFALLTIYEMFHMPLDLVAFTSMRFHVKSEGLVNVSGFQVDPGYDGLFIFSVYNAGPKEVHLKYKSKVFTILFAKTSKPAKSRKKGFSDIPIKMWDPLIGTRKISLIGLNERMEKLERLFGLIKYLIPTIAGIVAIVILLGGVK